MYRVKVLRLNKNVWLVVFMGFTSAQVDSILSALNTDYSDVDYSKKINMVASSVPGAGYYVVQLDRTGSILPPKVRDLLIEKANAELAGVAAVSEE